eukprot:TCONS_00063338-protein
MTVTKYTDRTRNVKKTLMISCLFVAFGNFIYAVPYHPLIILWGRLLQGIADSMLSVIQGEIIRIYEGTERTEKLSMCTMCYYVSYIGSPIVISIFTAVDFQLFGFWFKVYNFPFLLVGFLWASFVLVIFFFVTDLSKETSKLQIDGNNISKDTLRKPIRISNNQSPPPIHPNSIFKSFQVNFIL